jgi:hypothetical protein
VKDFSLILQVRFEQIEIHKVIVNIGQYKEDFFNVFEPLRISVIKDDRLICYLSITACPI